MRIPRWLRSLVARPNCTSARRSPRRPTHRPRLEALEDRTVPSTVNWVNPGSGDWDTASNWSTGAVPGATDNVQIATSGITVTHDQTIDDSVNSLSSQAAIALSAGSLTVAADSSFNGSLILSGGILEGTGDMTVSGPFTWDGGRLTGPAGSTLTAEGGLSIGGGGFLIGRSLVNDGAATWGGGQFDFREDPTFTNAPGATFDVQGDGTFGANDLGGTFVNEGRLVKSAGAGDSDFPVNFDNSGAVDVRSGTLSFGGWDSSQVTAGTSSGSFTGAAGTTLSFVGAATLTASSSIATAGGVSFDVLRPTAVAGAYSADGTLVNTGAVATVSFTGTVSAVGALAVSASANSPTVDFSPASGGPVTLTLPSLDLDGVLTGSDSFVVSGPFTWDGGRLTGPAGSTLTAEGGLSIGGGGFLIGRSLVNDGAATWGGGQFDFREDPTFTNAPGATFDVQGDGTFGANDLGGTFVNEGRLVKSAGAGDSDFPVNFDNSGAVDVRSGTLGFNQFVQSAGSTILDGGNVSGPLQIQGGVLTGAGTVFGSVSNQGQVSPGQPVGLIDVQGAYIQSPLGSLAVQLGGLTTGSQYSQLEGDSGIALGGPLQVSLVGGFTPQLGDTFTIVNNAGSAPINGAFAGLAEGATVWDATHSFQFSVSYVGGDGNDVVLTPTAVPLTVISTSSIMLVGNNPPPLTGFVNGTPFTGSITFTMPSGDAVTVTLGTSATSASPVGQYAITAALSGPGAGDFFIDPTTSHFGTMYVVSVGADPSSTTGAQAVTFWDNKGDGTKITAADLSSLDALNLVTQGGSAFDPRSVAQLQAWLSVSPNATTAYQLAVQLAAMDLNVLAGYVNTADLVYAGGLLPYANAYGVTGLTGGGFIDVQDLMNAANAALARVSPGAPSGDPNQAYEAALASVLQAADGNTDFVQQELIWNLIGLWPSLTGQP